MAHRHLKSPQTLSGRSTHLPLVTNLHVTLITKRSRPWSWMNDPHHFGSMSISLLFQRYSYCKIWRWKSMVKAMYVCGPRVRLHLTLKIPGQGHGQGQTHWSQLRPRVQSICLLFNYWQLDHFRLRNSSKLHILPWKFKGKVMAKVKSDGKIWGLEFNQYVCFLFHVNGTILGWDIAKCIFDLEIQGQGHNENWPKSKQVIYRPGP